MKPEITLFAVIATFFAACGIAYGFLTDWTEEVGFVGLFLSAGLGYMIAFYLWVVARKLPARPEDDENGEIWQQEGPYGTFAPYSWWPLWLALAASLVFLGVVVGFWLAFLGALVGVWALIGWVFEYYQGEHAH